MLPVVPYFSPSSGVAPAIQHTKYETVTYRKHQPSKACIDAAIQLLLWSLGEASDRGVFTDQIDLNSDLHIVPICAI